MAYLIGDGFDAYNTINDATSDNTLWDSGVTAFGGTASIGRFGVGGSIGIASTFAGSNLRKTGLPNEGHVWVTLANLKAIASTGGAMYVKLYDTASNAQMTIVFDYSANPGSIMFYRGNESGTLIATYSSAFNFNSFDHFQIEVVFSATVGEVHVRKNGHSSSDFDATGLNNITTANAYCNGVELGTKNVGNFAYFDDFLMFSATGAAPNTWVGDIRAIQVQPTFDTAQKQWTLNSTGALTLNNSSGTSTESLSADTLYVMSSNATAMSASQGGVLSSATVTFNAGFTGHAILGVYLMDGDTINFNTSGNGVLPGTLVGTSDAVTNPTATQVFTFSTNVPIKKGFRYTYALLTDAALTSKGSDARASYTFGISYGGGFPSLTGVPQVTTNTGRFPTVTATLAASNAGCVNDNFEDQGVTYLTDSTVSDYDLYDLEDLNYVPGSIVGVTIRGFVSKDNSGARGIKFTGKSGATSFDTNEVLPFTTYSYLDQFYPTDPNTGVAWTSSGINALQLGEKVSS